MTGLPQKPGFLALLTSSCRPRGDRPAARCQNCSCLLCHLARPHERVLRTTLAMIVGTPVRWRAQPDEGEHSGREREYGRGFIVTDREQKSAPIASAYK
jgi:hypothetical protein